MEGNDLDKYRFPKTLSEQNRIIGLPLDEAIPAAVVLLWGFFTKKYLFSLIIAAVIWQLIRAAKRGKSSRWLYNWCYFNRNTSPPTLYFLRINSLVPNILQNFRFDDSKPSTIFYPFILRIEKISRTWRYF